MQITLTVTVDLDLWAGATVAEGYHAGAGIDPAAIRQAVVAALHDDSQALVDLIAEGVTDATGETLARASIIAA